MPPLADRFTVVVPDLRGVGGSSVTFGGFNKRTMASDVAGLLDRARHLDGERGGARHWRDGRLRVR